jgi:hypothetical protein
MAKCGANVLFAAGLIVLGLSASASADTIANFTLDGVTFSDGGTATGSFTLDLTTSTLSNINISTSFTGPGFQVGDLGASYALGSFTNGPATFDFGDFVPMGSYSFAIFLSTTFTDTNLASPASFSIDSGSEGAFSVACEQENDEGICANRSITKGTLDEVPSATPLPATLPLFAGGLGFVGYLTRHKRRSRVAA